MYKIRDLIYYLESIAPLSFQEDYDNSGLIIGDDSAAAGGCLIGLDLTDALISEAIDQRINMIITHHPVIFGKLTRVAGRNQAERLVARAIKADIAVYAMHTNLDNIKIGVNHILGEKLGLKDMQILRKQAGLLKKLVTFCPSGHADRVREAIFLAGAGHIGNYDQCSYNLEGTGSFRAGEGANPFIGLKGETHFEPETRIETVFPSHRQHDVINALLEAHPYEEVAYDIYPLDNEHQTVGAGMTGYLDQETDETEFLRKIKSVLGTPCLRHSPLTGKKIHKVAVCGGAGSFLIREAMREKAGIFITSDIKYHQFHEAEGKIVIVDAGHFETEQFTLELIAGYLKKKFSNFAVLISETTGNPVNYF